MRLRICLIIALGFLSACAPAMRITPGQLPSASTPDTQLKSQAEYYVNQYIDESNFNEIKTGPDLKRVTTVVDRLSVAAGFSAHTFPVHLVNAGDQINAAAFSGASIVVYTGLLDRLKSDAELATVLGHEMGHILAKHYAEDEEQKSRAEAVSTGSSILGTIASVATSAVGYGGVSGLAQDVTEGTAGMVGYGAFVGSFDRRQEYEADHLGLLIMAKAGYDPHVAPEFWKRSKEVFGDTSSQVGAFFNTHPAEKDRQKALEEAMPYAVALYHPEAAPKVEEEKPKKGKAGAKAKKK